ncbi:MAG: hypothetical protein KAI79_18075, partial [Bacteroidales bacterium]|nr:hypothetical protein [Bacteroidales bacterium]
MKKPVFKRNFKPLPNIKIKAPSMGLDAQREIQNKQNQASNTRSKSIIFILLGIIICLLLVITHLVLSPSPTPILVPNNTQIDT